VTHLSAKGTRDEVADPGASHWARGHTRRELATWPPARSFIAALNSGDLDLMQQNWDRTGEIAMDNPFGGIQRGWVESRGVYERLFAARGQYRFEFYDHTVQPHTDVFIAIGRERGRLVASDALGLDLAIRTTGILRCADALWRQIHHHGSIENAEMLARYQQVVLQREA
jgi:hypothetical protein